MGLFFKKKVKDLPPLDLPPSPTRIEQRSFSDLPPLPPIPKSGAMKEESFSHLEELPPLPEIEHEKVETDKYEFPELPPLPEIEHEEPREHMMPEHEAQEWHDFFKEPEKMTPETLPHIEAPKPLKALELPEVEERQFHDLRPLFVKSDDYKEIMRGIQEIKAKVNESDSILLNLNEVKNQKDKEFQKMHNQIADIQRKLVYIDKTVFGG